MESTHESLTNPAAPGCYASPSVFSQDSTICQQCPAFESCGSACIETLKALRDKINIEDILARHRQVKASSAEPAVSVAIKPDFSRFMPSIKKPEQKVERRAPRAENTTEVSAEQEAIINTVPQKNARELAFKWIKKGQLDHIRTELAARRNPFASAKVNHEFIVCEALVAGPVTKTALKKAFMKRLGARQPWDEATASSHVGIVLPVLVAFAIAIETPEGFALNPSLVGDNVV
jgi:hypothetical protein